MEESREESQTLLPLFRPSPLDSIPIYNIVLEIRDIFVERIDTPLKYDQLRSPQVHSFLVKPLVAACKADLNQGTVYALLANMIQFAKESSSDVAMTGVLATRSMICEIVAIKLLKEYAKDDLISALTFDFYPLQTAVRDEEREIPRWQRISTLELAIKGEAKRFLANPAVIQVLEQIWNGNIMFQSSLHKLHRIKFANQEEAWRLGLGRPGPKIRYNYEDASIFKLSRLRVPRYRHILNLCSFCGMLCVYMLVLSRETSEVSISEIVFAFWSLGFIIDEIAGFTDVGFTLYFLSLWNLFDFIILVLLTSYAVARYLALTSMDPSLQRFAHDLLATVAIFLFPRLFSILDNYESFSRMVVSVRKMTIDLSVAWLVIVVFSSGFWVAFAMAFARDSSTNASKVAYDLMKILFGFTPTVWDSWNNYSVIGRFILLFYLFITHFVIMTILIAVLSNSFSMITTNSHEEHWYLFAVNTISMMKSESSSLFSYAPPLNIIEWIVRPTIYILPLQQFLVLNRTIIKITHFPVLLVIFLYERLYLSIKHVQLKKLYESENAIRQLLRNKQQQQQQQRQHPPETSTPSLPSTPGRRVRKRKAGEALPLKKRQQAKNKISNYELLDEVFKRPYKGTIKMKPQPIQYDAIGKTPTERRRRSKSSIGNHFSRTFSSGINSDPEESTMRRYSDHEELTDAFDDDEMFPAGAMSTITSWRKKRNSSVILGYRPSILSIRRSTTNHVSKTRKNIPIDDLSTNSREGKAGKTRCRLYSTASSIFRDNGQMLVLSPTRSTSSFMAKAGNNIRSQVRAWDLIREQNGEEAITDEEEEDEDEGGEVDSMEKVILDRLDTLERTFKRMQDLLEMVAGREKYL